MQRRLPSRIPLASLLALSLVGLSLTALAPGVGAESLPILLDGSFDEWTPGTLKATDPTGDDGGSGIDFTRLQLANDEDHLFIRYDTTVEVQPDEGQSIVLYLDTDMNASTGLSISGIGADLVWMQGARDGDFYTPSAQAIDHPDIGFNIATTVSNDEFEIAIDRHAVPAGGQALFPGNDFRMILRDSAGGGDQLPNSGSVSYSFVAGSQPVASLPLGKTGADHVRVSSYNIQNDGLFDGGAREDALDRMFDAIDADVWIICEVWNHNATEVRDMVEQFLPSGPGESWEAVMRDNGNVIVSRYPILASWEILPGNRLTGALLDLRPLHDSDLLVVANHWRCCTADANRQMEADALVEFLHDARNPGGSISLAPDTPIVCAGDFNLVGLRQQLDTLVTGDIQDNGSFGPDSPPDWDGSDLEYAMPRHPDARFVYTWRNDFSSFYPGQLDYWFYTGSVFELANHYVLETRTMLASTLSAAGLNAGDSFLASDHAPVVGDLDLNPGTPAPAVPRVELGTLLQNVPNPFNPSTRIGFVLTRAAVVELSLYDGRGRLVRTLFRGPESEGEHWVQWDGQDADARRVSSGVYRVRLRVEDDAASSVQSRAIVLVE